jgi:hypothetical protein
VKRAWLVLALMAPVAAWAAGIPGPQTVAPAKPVAHKPLFEVKFVLRPAPKTTGDVPRIDYSDRSAAIAPLRLGRQDATAFHPFAFSPNVEICRAWACETADRR